MRILSLRTGHHASAAIINDGKIEHYFKEERYSNVKHDWRIKKITDLIISGNYVKDVDCFYFDSDEPEEVVFVKKSIITSLNIDIKIIKPKRNQHHIYHAALSFYNSGFDRALILVVDSAGAYLNDETFECESVYVAEYPYKFTPIYKHFWTMYNVPGGQRSSKDDTCEYLLTDILRGGHHNIGNLYNSAAIAIGESVENCGKAMGLASYGKPIKDFNLFGSKSREKIYEYFKDYPALYDVLNFDNYTQFDVTITKENYQHFANYCYEVQNQCKDEVVKILDKYIKKTGIKKVCISGGYGMNIVTNYELTKIFPDIQFYFEPMCDDSGLSIGAAMYYYRMLTNDNRIFPIETTAHHGHHHDVKSYTGITSNVKDIAKLLSDNKSVAVYYGKAESGARALGNRSILFNALNPNAKDIVNEIKKREWYRPFAAIVLEEDAHLYFEDVIKNEFMTVCFPVKTSIIPGVTHVDKTCRVQTISGGHLYDILSEFKKLTGHGILLNTSFNLAGEVLVETPEQAFSTLNRSSLDYLWFYETKQLFKSFI